MQSNVSVLKRTLTRVFQCPQQPGVFEAIKELHYDHVHKAYEAYQNAEEIAGETAESSIIERQKDHNAQTALALLRMMKRMFESDEIYDKIVTLEQYVNEGMFSMLTLNLTRLNRELNRLNRAGTKMSELKPMFAMKLENLYEHYYISREKFERDEQFEQSEIITSETFE